MPVGIRRATLGRFRPSLRAGMTALTVARSSGRRIRAYGCVHRMRAFRRLDTHRVNPSAPALVCGSADPSERLAESSAVNSSANVSLSSEW